MALAPDRCDVVGVRGDPLPELLVGSLHLGVVSVNVLASEPEELVVVGSLEVMAARTFDCSHLSSFAVGALV
jgi:hypothetical protein